MVIRNSLSLDERIELLRTEFVRHTSRFMLRSLLEPTYALRALSTVKESGEMTSKEEVASLTRTITGMYALEIARTAAYCWATYQFSEFIFR